MNTADKRETTQPCVDTFTLFTQEHPHLEEVELHRQFRRHLFQQSFFADATWYALKCISLLKASEEQVLIDDYLEAESCAYSAHDLTTALEMIEQLRLLSPNNDQFVMRTGLYHMLKGDYKLAEKFYQEAYKLSPQNSNNCDALAHVNALLNRAENVVLYGNRALELKDREAMREENLSKVYAIVGDRYTINTPVPPFSPAKPERNVIAFSLWGSNPQYNEGAILNAIAAQLIYPGWSCRFYCDTTTPKKTTEKLIALGADVRMLQQNTLPFFGLFWRFFVAADPAVERYLIRDCDCILNCQERVAVDEWIQSGKHFHIMRDYASHTELIHAGMWGGVCGAIPQLTELIVDYYDNHGKERTIDQRFLRHYLWPIIKQSYYCHDSHFNFGSCNPFPLLGKYPKSLGNVGMDFTVACKNLVGKIL